MSKERSFDLKTAQLHQALESQKLVNDYDYNTMMSNFELLERKKQIIRKIKTRWAQEGKKFEETKKRMERNKAENLRKKSSELEQKMKRKQQILMTSLEGINKAKLESKERNTQKIIEKERLAKLKVEENLKIQDLERIQNEARTKEKIDNFIKKNQITKEKAHDDYAHKLAVIDNNHARNMEELKLKTDKEDKERKDKVLKKIIGFFYNKSLRDKTILERQKSQMDIVLTRKENKMNELYKQNEKKLKQIITKLHDNEVRKIEHDKKKAEYLAQIQQKRIKKELKCQKNREVLLDELKYRRYYILENECKKLERSYNKRNRTTNRLNHTVEQEKVERRKFERNLSAYKMQFKQLQNESILKKNLYERYEMFKEKKRIEEEQRKKELEDKMMNK